MSKFPECLRLDLTDALAGDGKVLADYFESVFRTIISQPKTHFNNFFLTLGECCKHLIGDLTQV